METWLEKEKKMESYVHKSFLSQEYLFRNNQLATNGPWSQRKRKMRM